MDYRALDHRLCELCAFFVAFVVKKKTMAKSPLTLRKVKFIESVDGVVSLLECYLII